MVFLRAGIAQSIQRLAMGCTIRGSNPNRWRIFRTRSDRPWGPTSFLYNGYRVSFSGVQRPGRGVKERVELYLYSPSGPAWPVLG